MGRKSRLKRERRERGSGPIALTAKGISQSDLLALLEAASVSPTACHRLPSLALIFDSVMRRTRTGQRRATSKLLPKLVAAAHEEDPRLASSEDWPPYDIRSEVLVRWAGDLHRLVPGSLERPVATIEFLRLLSSAIDPVLLEHNGYGLSDVVELILRRVNHVASTLASSWPSDETASVDDPARLDEEEFKAARRLCSITDQVALCSSPEQASVALRSHSAAAKRLACQPSDPNSSFGSTLAVLVNNGEYIALPAGILIESLNALAVTLASRACHLDSEVEDHWATVVADCVGRVLAGSRHSIVGPIWAHGVGELHSVTSYSERQALVMDVAASLDSSSLQTRLESSGQRLHAVLPGIELDTPSGSIHIADDAKMVRLQVIAAPKFGQPVLGVGDIIATLEDVLWFSRTCASEPIDLWYFVRDLTELGRASRIVVSDLIDAWEAWRENGKAFYRDASSPTMVIFAPHAAEVEWKFAADASPCEAALLTLGMPPLSEWPIIDGLDEIKYIGDLTQDIAFRLLPWRIPVAIAMTDPSCEDKSSPIWKLADGIAWKLEHSKPAFIRAADASGLSAIRINFLMGDSDLNGGAPMWLEQQSELVMTIGWDSSLLESLLEDSRTVETQAGQIIAERFPAGEGRDDFLAAWDAAPPGIRFDTINVAQHARNLSKPVKPHDSRHSAALRRLSAHLKTSGVGPRSYTGSSATQLESCHIYPWLLEELHRILSQCDYLSILEMALAELDRANFRRILYDKRIAWQRGFPVQSRPEPWEDQRPEIVTRIRSISLILEEHLAHPSHGSKFPDNGSWQDALSISDLCLESSLRSEAIHLELANATIIVSEHFGVQIEESNGPIDVDTNAYSRKRVSAMLPDAIPIGASTDNSLESESEDHRPIVEVMPTLDGINSSLMSTLGFSLDALIGALNVARQWEVTDASPIGRSTTAEIVNAAVGLGTEATEGQFQSAVEWLTLCGTSLRENVREHWETERRSVRITTRPFVEHEDVVYVLPWSAEMTLQILVNYLSDGRLPWPEHSLPKLVNRALNRYRQGRNRQLEDDCFASLTIPPMITVARVRPEKAERLYSITELSGEIDVLCLDPDRSRIWVIEVKDSYTPFSNRQVRRLVDKFHAKDGYVDKLLQKVDDIENSSLQLACALGIDNPKRTWQVIGLVVTRHPDPAAFAIDARVPFCVLSDVAQIVLHDELPALGFVDMSNFD